MNKKNKTEVEILKEKITKKVLSSPQKAAVILKQWIDKKPNKSKKKKVS